MIQSVLLVALGGLDPTGVYRGKRCFLKCLFVDIDTSLAVWGYREEELDMLAMIHW